MGGTAHLNSVTDLPRQLHHFDHKAPNGRNETLRPVRCDGDLHLANFPSNFSTSLFWKGIAPG